MTMTPRTTPTPLRAPPWRSPRVVVSALSALVLLSLALPVSGVGTYDPCASQPSAATGDGFTLGVLYYPGGDLDAWTDDAHPCLYQARANLTSAGAVSAVYRPVLDRMSFLRSSPDEETALMTGNAHQVMTVVAYAGNGTDVVRSPPRRVRVASASAVAGGASVVGRVNALTLIARFDAGSLRYLQWHDLGCGDCAAEDECFDVGDGHTACAGTETNCGCDAAVAAASGSSCLLDLSAGSADHLRCQLTIATAFSGTDKHLVPLDSAAQIERLGRYSVTGALRGTGAGALAAAVTG